MIFKIIIRNFCDHRSIKLLNRNIILTLLKNAKLKSGLKYSDISKKLNKSEIYVASCFNGEHPLSSDDFEKIYQLFYNDLIDYDKEICKNLLKQIPIRGQNRTKILNDPTVYRLNEIVNIYGLSIKELIEEKAGSNGIMSAIDCKIDVDIIEDNEKIKRIEIKINGKLLNYNL